MLEKLLRKLFSKRDDEPDFARQRSAGETITAPFPGKHTGRRYGFAVFCVAVAFLLRYFLTRFIGDELPLMLFVAAALAAAAYGGAIPGAIALLLGLVLGDSFFIGIKTAPHVPLSLGTLQVLRSVFIASVGIILIEILHRSQLRTRKTADELRAEIARRKITEASLAAAQAQLSRHAEELEHRVKERTAGLEGLLYHIAHNLRAPLRTMDGFATLLAQEYAAALDQTGRDYTQRICGAAERMDELIHDLLDFGRLSHIEFELHRVNLDLVMERVLHDAAYSIKTKAAEVIVNGPLPDIWAVENVAAQVLFNLLDNALKFVPPDRAPRVQISAEQRESTVRVCVQDNGIGIGPQYHECIFNVFEQLHGAAYEGTGIGLAIVKQSMRRMRGQAGVESRPGQGSRFWVEFSSIPLPRI